MTTGERIKEARLAAHLTQKELAEKVGVKFSAIHKYEAGIVVNLKRETIDALARALNVKPSWLLCLDLDDNFDPFIIGKQISRIREYRGISQERLASALETDVQTIQRYERGLGLNSPGQLDRIAQVLNCSIGMLTDSSSGPLRDRPYDPDVHYVVRSKSESAAIIDLIKKEKNPPSLEDYLVLHDYLSLSDEGKTYIRRTLDMAMKSFPRDESCSDQ